MTSHVIKSAEQLQVQHPALIKKIQESVQKNFLEVSVEDTGMGIKEEDKPKLFKLFGYLDENKEYNNKGVGLGLHICKKITNIFEGDIVCQSE